MNESRLEQLEKNLEDIKEGQQRIITALLGKVDEDKIGLMEETRTLKKDVKSIQAQLDLQTAQIADALEFKKDVKKIVLGIGFSVPIVWEVLKFCFSGAWDFIKGK